MKAIIVIFTFFMQFSYAQKSLTTFNMGLAHSYVPYASERIEKLIESLKNHETDILCLQEVWRKEDRNLVIESLRQKYPHAHFTKIKQERASKKPVCKVRELFGKDKFVTCTLKQCKKLDGDEFTECVINKCNQPLKKLRTKNRPCAAALMAQVGKSSTAAIWAVVNPFKAASLFSYGGGNGLLMLSKREMLKKEVLDFSDISTLSRRQSLYSEIDGVGVYCTHLSANLENDAPYAGKFSSWGEENFAQAKRLSSLALEKTVPTVLMGDFNCGYSIPGTGIEEDLAKSCQEIHKNFSDPIVELNPECTFCRRNDLAGTEKDRLIDHIFLRGLEAKSAEVVFKEFIDIEIDGDIREVNLSDHFGVQVIAE